MKNVILLTIDTLRRDVIGCYGGKGGLTPFTILYRIGASGLTMPFQQVLFYKQHFPGILTSSYYLEYGPQNTQKPSKERF